MILDNISGLLEGVTFKQLISKKEINKREFEIKLQGRVNIWTIRLYFGNDFPYKLPLAKLINKEFIGKIPHVNQHGIICVEESDTILINYHTPASVIELFLHQTIKTLERSSLKIFQHELYDEIEGFLHGENTVNSFYRSSLNVDDLYLYVQRKDTLFKIDITIPILISDNNLKTNNAFENISSLNGLQRIKIIHIPLDRPFVPMLNNMTASALIREISQKTSDGNNLEIRKKLRKHGKLKRQYYILISMPRTNGERTELLISFKSKLPSLHPILNNEHTSWNIELFLVNRYNKEYLLQRGGAKLNFNKKTVSIIGCGSIGSQIAIQIAKSGIGKLRLIDGDIFTQDNIYRHYLGGRYLNFTPSTKNGKAHYFSKVLSLKKEIESNVPYLVVDAFPESLSQKNITRTLGQTDIVIVAIGDPSISLFVNKIMRENGFSNVIFCWNEPDGYGGHSAALNLKNACLECLLFPNDLDENNINFVQFGQPISKNLTGCAGVFTPFSNLDSIKTATLATEQAINYLNQGIIEEVIYSWKGRDNGTLQTTERFKNSNFMESLSVQKNPECRCCNNEQ